MAARLGAGVYVAGSELRLALIDRLEGDLPGARARLEALRRNAAPSPGREAEPDAEQVWLQDALALALGSLARAEGHHDEARTLLHGALRRLHRRGEGAFLRSAVCLVGVLEIAARREPRGACTLLARAPSGAGPLGPIHMPDCARRGARLPGCGSRQTLARGRWTAVAAAWADGQAMPLEQAVAYALEEARRCLTCPRGR